MRLRVVEREFVGLDLPGRAGEARGGELRGLDPGLTSSRSARGGWRAEASAVSEHVGGVFAALTDLTRWRVLKLLAMRGMENRDGARKLPVSRRLVVKQLRVLDRVGARREPLARP